MNFVQLHLGDWIAGTALLSPTERGVYMDLLVRYYKEERPIMQVECKRIARAYAPHEADAMQYVLETFFTLEDGVYRHSRCDEEIAKAAATAEKRKKAANARWTRDSKPKIEHNECECSADGMQTECTCMSTCNANGMLTNNHKPITNNHKEEKKETKKKSAAPKAPKAAPVEKPEGVSDELWAEWYAHKKRKSGSVTQRMLDGLIREAGKAGITVAEAMEYQLEKGWTGFEADWYEKTNGSPKNSRNLHTDPQWGIGVCELPPEIAHKPFDPEAQAEFDRKFEIEKQKMIEEGLIF